ncbi:hypothetical protein FIBSPDRAFT_894027 [Athelia psychrophila]|uniref:Myb/SANT-like domain-containing protein n=1 Tax=Athelia psychrophila TaxID=1759441 RepID=A0A166GFR0_9AGAM|nr:hypothetical protein FIBSPDRAFT_894027 [Fibularhizoctonia sp. CBS 109695]
MATAMLENTSTSTSTSGKHWSDVEINHLLDNLIELRTSGTHWDNNVGTNIIGDAVNHTWESHLTTKAGENMKPFRNKGWKFWNKFEEVNPNQMAGGIYCRKAIYKVA